MLGKEMYCGEFNAYGFNILVESYKQVKNLHNALLERESTC